MDSYIGEWPYYNFAARSFHTKKPCSTLSPYKSGICWNRRVSVPTYRSPLLHINKCIYLFQQAIKFKRDAD